MQLNLETVIRQIVAKLKPRLDNYRLMLFVMLFPHHYNSFLATIRFSDNYAIGYILWCNMLYAKRNIS